MELPELILNPNQPKNRMKVPMITKGTLCIGNWLAVPSELYLPMRGADHGRAGQSDEAAYRVHHTGTGIVGSSRKSDGVQGAEPATAPDPMAVEGVDDCADHEAVGQVRLRLGPLGNGSRHDGGSGSGEHHLEHPVNVDLPVVGPVNQEEVAGAGNTRSAGAGHYGETKSQKDSDAMAKSIKLLVM